MIAHAIDHEARVWLHNEDCETCNAILRRAFNDIMPGLQLGPNGADMLLRRICEVAAELRAIGPAS